MTRTTIISGAVILALSSLISRVLGVIRDRIFATEFGILNTDGIFSLDTYYAAFRIPDLIFQLLIIGAVSTAFVPIFSQYYHAGHEEQKEKAWKFLDTTLTGIGISMVALCAVLFAAVPYITPYLVPGFSAEKIEVTINLTRIMLVSPILFGLSSIFQSVENAAKKYVHFALAPIFYNLSIIIAALLYAKTYGVHAIAWGVVIGALLHAAVQLPAILSMGYRYHLNFNFQNKDFKEFIKLGIPRIFSAGISQINLLIDTLIASTFIAGSITAFNFAFNIQSLPLGLIGVSISIVAFGIFSEQMAKEDHVGMLQTLRAKIENITIYIFPATVGMIILRGELVDVILRGGKFTSSDSSLTATLLGIFAISLLTQNLIPLFSRFFFAQKNTTTPVIISIFGLILNASGSIMLGLILKMGIQGTVISFALSNILQCILLMAYIRKGSKEKIFTKTESIKYGKIIMASIVMGSSVYGLQQTIKYITLPSLFQSLYTLTITSVIGFLIYFFILRLLKYPNYQQYLRLRANKQN